VCSAVTANRIMSLPGGTPGAIYITVKKPSSQSAFHIQ
jgi:hypothetical protein